MGKRGSARCSRHTGHTSNPELAECVTIEIRCRGEAIGATAAQLRGDQVMRMTMTLVRTVMDRGHIASES